MNKIILGILASLILINYSYGEVLLTANTLGQGRFGFKTGCVSSTYAQSSLSNNLTYGLMLGYGIIPNLDIYGTAGFVNYTELARLMPGYSVNGPVYGMELKYGLIEDSEYTPLNLSSLFAFKATNITAAYNSPYGNYSSNSLFEDWGAGLILSKTFGFAAPYLSTLYHFGSIQDTYGYSIHYTGLELALGVNFMIFENTGLLLEATNNTLIPDHAGSSATMNNYSFSVGQKI
ncbi:MAG: hypothetical protein WC624_07110 [Candidatus Margulisiibacteriota bacterium]